MKEWQEQENGVAGDLDMGEGKDQVVRRHLYLVVVDQEAVNPKNRLCLAKNGGPRELSNQRASWMSTQQTNFLLILRQTLFVARK